MDKHKALRIDQDDAAGAVEKALSFAKQRVTELNNGEINDVAGGATVETGSPGPDVLMGFFPTGDEFGR